MNYSTVFTVSTSLPKAELSFTAISVFLTLLLNEPFRPIVLRSQTIGLSILGLHLLGHRLFRGRQGIHPWLSVAAVPLGAGLGVAVTSWLEGGKVYDHGGRALLVTGAVVVVFGAVMAYYFDARARLAIGAVRLQEELLAREAAARGLAEAELKLLQAQIEPHFLFNTLSTVVRLMDGDPPRARRMLLNLTSYLRGALRRTRAGSTSLGEELDLVHAYLEIQAVRMGGRLRFSIDCPEELREVSLPPLLVQPLVENSIRHALEPRPEGGTLSVRVALEGEELLVEVQDDGPGLDPHRPAGIGLTNVRERVQAFSLGRGSLLLLPPDRGGLCARISLPRSAVAGPAPGVAAGGRP